MSDPPAGSATWAGISDHAPTGGVLAELELDGAGSPEVLVRRLGKRGEERRPARAHRLGERLALRASVGGAESPVGRAVGGYAYGFNPMSAADTRRTCR